MENQNKTVGTSQLGQELIFKLITIFGTPHFLLNKNLNKNFVNP